MEENSTRNSSTFKVIVGTRR